MLLLIFTFFGASLSATNRCRVTVLPDRTTVLEKECANLEKAGFPPFECAAKTRLTLWNKDGSPIKGVNAANVPASLFFGIKKGDRHQMYEVSTTVSRANGDVIFDKVPCFTPEQYRKDQIKSAFIYNSENMPGYNPLFKRAETRHDDASADQFAKFYLDNIEGNTFVDRDYKGVGTKMLFDASGTTLLPALQIGLKLAGELDKEDCQVNQGRLEQHLPLLRGMLEVEALAKDSGERVQLTYDAGKIVLLRSGDDKEKEKLQAMLASAETEIRFSSHQPFLRFQQSKKIKQAVSIGSRSFQQEKLCLVYNKARLRLDAPTLPPSFAGFGSYLNLPAGISKKQKGDYLELEIPFQEKNEKVSLEFKYPPAYLNTLDAALRANEENTRWRGQLEISYGGQGLRAWGEGERVPPRFAGYEEGAAIRLRLPGAVAEVPKVVERSMVGSSATLSFSGLAADDDFDFSKQGVVSISDAAKKQINVRVKKLRHGEYQVERTDGAALPQGATFQLVSKRYQASPVRIAGELNAMKFDVPLLHRIRLKILGYNQVATKENLPVKLLFDSKSLQYSIQYIEQGHYILTLNEFIKDSRSLTIETDSGALFKKEVKLQPAPKDPAAAYEAAILFEPKILAIFSQQIAEKKASQLIQGLTATYQQTALEVTSRYIDTRFYGIRLKEPEKIKNWEKIVFAEKENLVEKVYPQPLKGDEHFILQVSLNKKFDENLLPPETAKAVYIIPVDRQGKRISNKIDLEGLPLLDGGAACLELHEKGRKWSSVPKYQWDDRFKAIRLEVMPRNKKEPANLTSKGYAGGNGYSFEPQLNQCNDWFIEKASFQMKKQKGGTVKLLIGGTTKSELRMFRRKKLIVKPQRQGQFVRGLNLTLKYKKTVYLKETESAYSTYFDKIGSGMMNTFLVQTTSESLGMAEGLIDLKINKIIQKTNQAQGIDLNSDSDAEVIVEVPEPRWQKGDILFKVANAKEFNVQDRDCFDFFLQGSKTKIQFSNFNYEESLGGFFGKIAVEEVPTTKTFSFDIKITDNCSFLSFRVPDVEGDLKYTVMSVTPDQAKAISMGSASLSSKPGAESRIFSHMQNNRISPNGVTLYYGPSYFSTEIKVKHQAQLLPENLQVMVVPENEDNLVDEPKWFDVTVDAKSESIYSLQSANTEIGKFAFAVKGLPNSFVQTNGIFKVPGEVANINPELCTLAALKKDSNSCRTTLEIVPESALRSLKLTVRKRIDYSGTYIVKDEVVTYEGKRLEPKKQIFLQVLKGYTKPSHRLDVKYGDKTGWIYSLFEGKPCIDTKLFLEKDDGEVAWIKCGTDFNNFYYGAKKKIKVTMPAKVEIIDKTKIPDAWKVKVITAKEDAQVQIGEEYSILPPYSNFAKQDLNWEFAAPYNGGDPYGLCLNLNNNERSCNDHEGPREPVRAINTDRDQFSIDVVEYIRSIDFIQTADFSAENIDEAASQLKTLYLTLDFENDRRNATVPIVRDKVGAWQLANGENVLWITESGVIQPAGNSTDFTPDNMPAADFQKLSKKLITQNNGVRDCPEDIEDKAQASQMPKNKTDKFYFQFYRNLMLNSYYSGKNAIETSALEDIRNTRTKMNFAWRYDNQKDRPFGKYSETGFSKVKFCSWWQQMKHKGCPVISMFTMAVRGGRATFTHESFTSWYLNRFYHGGVTKDSYEAQGYAPISSKNEGTVLEVKIIKKKNGKRIAKAYYMAKLKEALGEIRSGNKVELIFETRQTTVAGGHYMPVYKNDAGHLAVMDFNDPDRINIILSGDGVYFNNTISRGNFKTWEQYLWSIKSSNKGVIRVYKVTY